MSFHNRNSWKLKNENERNFSGEKTALFLWGFYLVGVFLCAVFIGLCVCVCSLGWLGFFVVLGLGFFKFGLIFWTWIKLLRDLTMQEVLSQSYLLLLLWAGMLFLGITSSLSSGSSPVFTKKWNYCSGVFSWVVHNDSQQRIWEMLICSCLTPQNSPYLQIRKH